MDKGAETLPPPYDAHPIDARAIASMFAIGIVTGIVGWLLYLGVAHFFVEPVFCRSADTFAICRSGGTIAWGVAHLLALAAAVAVLARLAVYRPLLVALSVLVGLWGTHAWLGGMTWYSALIWQAVLFGLAFATFGWIARSTNFIIALVASLVVAVLARIILMVS